MRTHLWDPWKTAEAVPDRPAVIVGTECWTFADLVARADALARGLPAFGVPEAAVISTDIPSGPKFFAIALAALRYGYGLFPIERDLFRSSVGPRLLADQQVRIHVTDDPTAGDYWHGQAVLDDDVAAAGGSEPRAGSLPHAGYLTYATSGTTGEPVAVPRAVPRRPYRGVAVVDKYGAGIARGPHLMANPAYHLGTLGPALYALQAASAVVVQPRWSPSGFADLVDRHAVDSTMFSPDHLRDLVESQVAPRHRLQVIFHGGDACPPGRKRDAIDLLGPILHEYYGTSRGTLTEITTPEWFRHPGSVGRPLPGVRIEIRAGDQLVPAGEAGEICVRLRAADLRSEDESGLRTGDLGFVDPDGYLFVIGRAGTPESFPLARLEHEIRQLPGVTNAAVLPGSPPVCHLETVPAREIELIAAVQRAALGLGLGPVKVICARSGALPRTASGKVRRADLDRDRRAGGMTRE